ncbi:MAG: aminopeptidase [Bacteroidota bacterium]|nr:aminopeptidase [Bacteroidota bacterium]MDP4193014.1 aminopeptidase [Bacteroidota bacterium]MDP4197161.1 aminopeptidase [Bacteroidota bacterium]
MALSKLDKAAIIAIKDCMGTKKNEKVLVITDEIKREIGYSLYLNAQALGYKSLLVEMKARKGNGEEPPEEVAELMLKYDVVLCATDKSLTHTEARRNASAKGARVATFPGITKEVMIRGLNADYKKISALSIKLKKIFEKTKTVRVTSPGGTDITMDISGRTAYASKGLFHKKGESGNLPTGETFVAPLEGKSEGVFVVDGSMAGVGMLGKNSVIKIKVEKGYATEITGGKEAKKLIELLSKNGKAARNIAEFGVGTNDKAKLSGILLEDEKVMGTVHIALGDNKSMGGNVHVPSHLDGLINKPTVYFDDKVIMKNGKLLIK